MARPSTAELHANSYSECYSHLERAFQEGDYDAAVESAVHSFEHIPQMLTYLGRRLGGEPLPRVETIDFLLRYCPILLHDAGLELLGEFLRSKRAVVKKLPCDILQELQEANTLLREGARIYNSLQVMSPMPCSEVATVIGDHAGKVRDLLAQWEEMGMLWRATQETGEAYMLLGADNHRVKGKCGGCGAVGAGNLYKLLNTIQCPRCKTHSQFSIIQLRI